MSNIQRLYFPGEEWIFLKLYTGTQLAETILLESIQPTVTAYHEAGKISEWHFVRYEDPENHLRVRLKCSDKNNSELSKELLDILRPYTKNNGLWDIKICTYRRELERYGENFIEIVESIFTKQSFCALDLIMASDTPEQKFIFSAINILLNVEDLFVDLDEMIRFFKNGQDAFFKEFNLNKEDKKELSKSYIENQDDLKNQLTRFRNGSKPFDKRLYWSVDLQKRDGFIEYVKKHYLLSDLIHMFVNRLFTKEQRKNEAILYFFLYKMASFLKHYPVNA